MENQNRQDPELEVLGENDNVGSEDRKKLQSLTLQAMEILDDVENRTQALAIAATERWTPKGNELETDEISLLLDDEGYDELIEMTRILCRERLFIEVSRYMGIPEEIVHKVATASLLSELHPAPPARVRPQSDEPVVARRVVKR